MPSRRDKALRFACAMLAVLREIHDQYEMGGDPQRESIGQFQKDWGQIEKGQGRTVEFVQHDEFRGLCSEYPVAGAYLLAHYQHPSVWVKWLEVAVDAAQKLGDREAEARHIGHHGNASTLAGDYERARQCYAESLAIANDLGAKDIQLSALGNLGMTFKNLGNVRRAADFHEQALAMSREIGDRKEEGNALGNLGTACRHLGEYERAFDLYGERLKIARELGRRGDERNALGNIGSVYSDLGEHERAIEYHEQSLAISKELQHRRGEAIDLCHLAKSREQLQEFDAAIGHLEEALELFREVGDNQGEENVLCDLEAVRGVAQAWMDLETQEPVPWPNEWWKDRNEWSKHGVSDFFQESQQSYEHGEVAKSIEVLEWGIRFSREVGTGGAIEQMREMITSLEKKRDDTKIVE